METLQSLEVQEDYVKGLPLSQSRHYTAPLNDKNNILPRLLHILKNYLSVFGIVLIVSYLLSIHFCVLKEDVGRANIMSSLLIGIGVPSLLVHFFTTKYMVVGNLRLGYLFSSLLLLQSELTCPGDGDLYSMGSAKRAEHTVSHLRELQGTMMCVSLIHALIGVTVMKWASILKPVTLAPTLIIAGLMVAKTVATHLATGGCCLLFIITVSIILVLYYMTNKESLNSMYGSRTCRGKLHLAVVGCGLVWGGCAILSSVGFPNTNASARTDVYTGIFQYLDDYKISYPFRWGLPIFRLKSIIIVCPAILVSILEAAADCYKQFAISEKSKTAYIKQISGRIILEGGCTFLSSILGISVGISVGVKSERYGSTKSGKIMDSYGSVLLILIAFSGTLCAFFTVIPQPILVALTFVAFGSLVVEGIGMIRFIEFDKRNVYIMGISIFLGIVIPELAQESQNVYLKYLFFTGSFVTAISSIVLDFILQDANVDNNEQTVICDALPLRSHECGNFKSTTVDICECFSSFFA